MRVSQHGSRFIQAQFSRARVCIVEQSPIVAYIILYRTSSVTLVVKKKKKIREKVSTDNKNVSRLKEPSFLYYKLFAIII